MGKYSDFERLPRDFYKTPLAALKPLLPHLQEVQTFAEPCAGDGQLIRLLETVVGLNCTYASDIDPQDDNNYHIVKADALESKISFADADCIITNPPWDRRILHKMITHFAETLKMPTWLLFDAGWVHTKQSIPFQPLLRKIVPVGRVKWIEDSKMTGKEDCAWHLFHPSIWEHNPTKFYGRQ